ncbi:MAG: hypothetical protein NDF51_06150, partial [archaeon YNP-WB-040]|nr:hypothetical protein [Candidatus Culexarchaeum yellowstonense]
MKAKYILIFELMLFVLLNVANAQIYYTDFSNSTYKDMCFVNVNQYPYGYLNTFAFISTKYLNETRYFVFAISHDVNYGTNYYIVRRFDSFCNLEDVRTAASTGGCIGNVVPQIGNTYFWFGGDDLLIPIWDSCQGTIELLRFNITNYVSGGGGGQWIYDYDNPLFKSAPGSYGDRVSLGTIMSKGYYTDMVANLSLPIVMAKDDQITVCYDFYDLENHVATKSNMKCIQTGGASGIKKVYVLPTGGHCFQWRDCLFHVIYEGNSSQNNNRYGIYVREIHKGFFGYEFVDRGFIPLTSDTVGFVNDYIVGITKWWYYPGNYPELVQRIYALVITPSGERKIAYLVFDIPSYYIINKQVINYHDNNALAPYARNLWSTTLIGYGAGCSGGTFSDSTWINGTKLYKNFYLGGTVYTSACAYTGCSATLTVKIYDYYNGTLIGTATCSATTPSSAYGSSASTPCFSRISLPENISLYNISLTYSASGTGCGWTWANVYHDIIGSNSKFTVTLASNGVETFTVSPVNEGSSYFMYQVPTEVTCICTEWTYKGCYNSTHDYWTRTCSPIGCSDEIRFALNQSCAAVTTTTTTIVGAPPIPGAPPGAGYTGGLFNLTGTALQLNISGAALVGIAIIDRIFSLAGIATLIVVALTAVVGYYTKSGQVAAIVALLMVMLFTII